MKKCNHEFDWDKAWMPAKIFMKPHGFLPKGSKVLPLTKYWSSNCKKCGEEIVEYQIPYEKSRFKDTKYHSFKNSVNGLYQ